MKITTKISKNIAIELITGTKIMGKVKAVTEDELVIVPQAVGHDRYGKQLVVDDPNRGEIHVNNNAIAMWQYM